MIRENLNYEEMAGGVPEPLTKEQVALLKSTFRSIDGYKMGELFYQKLFSKHPQLRAMFSENLDEQITKIISVIELVVYSFEERSFNQFFLQESLLVPFRDLGRKHSQKGVIYDHYPIANSLLLEALQEVGSNKIDNLALMTWKQALDHLTYAMLNDTVEVAAVSKTPREAYQWIKRLLKQA